MENTIPADSKKFPTKLIVIGVLILVLVLGLIASLFLVRQNQNVEKEASVSTGVVKTFITPETKNVIVGEEFTADILIDTSGQYISALTIQVEFTYSGDPPPIDATEVTTNTDLVTSDEWTFPLKTVTTQTGKTIVKVSGFNKLQTGWASSGEEKVATIVFEAFKNGKIEVVFNSSDSKVTSKTTTQDILLIPSSKGVYTASGGEESTPTPSGSANPSPSPSPSGSGSPTPAPIPVTGASTPTIIGISVGTILLIGSIFFAF